MQADWQNFYRSLNNKGVDTPPVLLDQTEFPTVPFEHYMVGGAKNVCIQRAMFVSLILERMGVANRVVNGTVANRPFNAVDFAGHTWIELWDGRIFDPQWKIIAPKGPGKDGFQGFEFGGQMRFENSSFPFLEITSGA